MFHLHHWYDWAGLITAVWLMCTLVWFAGIFWLESRKPSAGQIAEASAERVRRRERNELEREHLRKTAERDDRS